MPAHRTIVKRYPQVQRAMHDAFASGVFAMGLEALRGIRASTAFTDRSGKLRAGATAVLYLRGSEARREGPSGVSGGDTGGSDILVVVGLPFPGRFLETGTINMAPRPSVGPAVDAAAASGEATIERVARAEWPRG